MFFATLGFISSFISIGAITLYLASKQLGQSVLDYSSRTLQLSPVTEARIIPVLNTFFQAVSDVFGGTEVYPPILWIALVFFFLLLIWSYFGASISRIACLECSRDHTVGMDEALGYANKTVLKNIVRLLPWGVLGSLFVMLFWWTGTKTNNSWLVFAGVVLIIMFLPAVVGNALLYPMLYDSEQKKQAPAHSSTGFSMSVLNITGGQPVRYTGAIIMMILQLIPAAVLVFGMGWAVEFLVNYLGLLVAGDTFRSIATFSGEGGVHTSTSTLYHLWMYIFEVFVLSYVWTYVLCYSAIFSILSRKWLFGIDVKKLFGHLPEGLEKQRE